MNLDDTASELLSLFAGARQSLIAALPNLVTALVVLVVGWSIAWALRRLVHRVFRKLAGRIPGDSSRIAWNEAVHGSGSATVAANGVYWLVLLTTWMIAVDALGLPVFSRWIAAFAAYLPKFFIAAALVFGAVVAGRVARNAITRAAARFPGSQAKNLGRFTQAAIVTASVLIAAGQLGLDVSLLTTMFLIVLAAALGGAALAFGLGAKDLMADILAMHYVSKSYRVGQMIQLGQSQGRIERITRTAVVIHNASGELSIPGRHFAGGPCVLLSEEQEVGA